MADNFADDRSGGGEQLVLSHVRFQVDLRGIRGDAGGRLRAKVERNSERGERRTHSRRKIRIMAGNWIFPCVRAVQLNY